MNMTRRRFLGGLGALAATSGRAAHPAAEEELPGAGIRSIGMQKVLLVDHEFITKSDGVRLRLHPPRKTGARLIESEYPWESATLNWFSVLHDGALYRMWYECYDVDGWPTPDDTSFCYAESTDGIRWTKPKLGLFAYRGSKANNILFRQIGEGSHRSRVHGSGVFLDQAAPPEARYKCVSQGQFQGIAERPYFVAGMTSPDGLHWTRLPKPICNVFADSQYSGLWDSRERRYVIYGRVSGHGGRAIGRAAGSRFDEFAPLTRVLQTGPDDPPESDLYNPACLQCPGIPGLTLMFPSLFRHREDTLDIHLAVSRDGVNWTRPERDKPFIPLGDPADFDGGSLYMGNGGCLLTGDELSFYFSGSTLRHGQVDLKKLTIPANRRVITRAVSTVDRLVSATAGPAGGTFETPTLRFTGDRLVVNATARTGGRVRIALLDAEGRPIPGHGLEDCRALQADNDSWTVTWADRQMVTHLSTQPIRIRIALHDADIFAFQFCARNS